MEIANSPAIAAPIPEPASSEPISPELVLVDPELRRALQARASERPPLQVVADAELRLLKPAPAPEPVALPKLALPTAGRWPIAAPQPLPETPQPRRGALAWTRRRVVPVVLPISLALNAILIAFAVSDARVASEPSPAPPALDATAPGNGGQKQAKPAGTNRPADQSPKPRNGALERKLLNLVVQAPAGKLPRALIDSKTGLAKNGLQAVCRRENGLRSFLCVVQPPKHKAGEGLYVRYRLNRKGNGGTFTWYRYRNG
jgi:hypothetical protein